MLATSSNILQKTNIRILQASFAPKTLSSIARGEEDESQSLLSMILCRLEALYRRWATYQVRRRRKRRKRFPCCWISGKGDTSFLERHNGVAPV